MSGTEFQSNAHVSTEGRPELESAQLLTTPVIIKRRRLGTVGVLALTCTFGMLIWVKLRVVESVPRQAYAEPKHMQGERAPAGFKQGKTPAAAMQLPGQSRVIRAPEPAEQVTVAPGNDPARTD